MTVMSERPPTLNPMNEGTLIRHIDPIMDDQKLWDIVSSGDLGPLTPAQRTQYYLHRCREAGLAPGSQPFTYLKLGGKGILYANKTATDQLRELRGVSVLKVETLRDDEYISFGVTVVDAKGRQDYDIGEVFVGQQQGESRANARKKALTQAKRRATLSICGLGALDETEVVDLPAAEAWEAGVTGVRPAQPNEHALRAMTKFELGAHLKHLREELGWSPDDLRQDVAANRETMTTKEGTIAVALRLQGYVQALKSERESDVEATEAVGDDTDAVEGEDGVLEGMFTDLPRTAGDDSGGDRWTQ